MSVAVDLPTLPAAHTRALAMMSRHDAGAAEIAAIVEGDPALTASVLRASNSAAFAPLSPIRTANNAIVRIGLAMTRRIVAGAALGSAFSNLSRSGMDVDELWRHVIACALLADATAWADGPRTEAFTAGILHDIGRLAMAAGQPEQYAQVVELVRAGLAAEEAEQQVFGVDHIEWGVEVGKTWDFPPDVVEAIAEHHDGGGSPLTWVTWNGRRVAWSLGIGDGLVVPDDVSFDPDSDDAGIVDAAGGAEDFASQIEWYRGAFSAAA